MKPNNTSYTTAAAWTASKTFPFVVVLETATEAHKCETEAFDIQHAIDRAVLKVGRDRNDIVTILARRA